MKSIAFLLLLCGAVAGCGPQSSEGYGEMEELYKESVKALQTKDSVAIRSFVRKAFPDGGTADYMYAKNYHYRGFPDGLKGRPGLLDTMRTVYTQRFYRFAMQLDGRNQLKDLRFIGFDENPEPRKLSSLNEVLFTEPFGKCVSGTDTIEYKIGELLKVNGKWKSFSDPKL